MVKKAQTAELSVEEQAIAYTDSLVEKALAAEALYATYSQEQVDKIVAAMALAGSEHSLELAQEAVAETKRGVVEDKDTKTTLRLKISTILSKMRKPLVSLARTRFQVKSKSQHRLVF